MTIVLSNFRCISCLPTNTHIYIIWMHVLMFVSLPDEFRPRWRRRERGTYYFWKNEKPGGKREEKELAVSFSPFPSQITWGKLYKGLVTSTGETGHKVKNKRGKKKNGFSFPGIPGDEVQAANWEKKVKYSSPYIFLHSIYSMFVLYVPSACLYWKPYIFCLPSFPLKNGNISAGFWNSSQTKNEWEIFAFSRCLGNGKISNISSSNKGKKGKTGFREAK